MVTKMQVTKMQVTKNVGVMKMQVTKNVEVMKMQVTKSVGVMKMQVTKSVGVMKMQVTKMQVTKMQVTKMQVTKNPPVHMGEASWIPTGRAFSAFIACFTILGILVLIGQVAVHMDTAAAGWPIPEHVKVKIQMKYISQLI